ncbi:MAG: sensor histidine kinase [Elusimicrobia bacterium]|nr:sensor histidine kinase [Elusimicrobiota bacterium]
MGIKDTFSDIYDSFYKKRFHILVTCFAVLLNWAGHSFVYENSYRFLTFDMVGTFVVAMTLGTVWALIAAIATPIVLSNITSPHFIYVAVINMTGALVWGWLAETGNLIIFNTKSKNKNSFKQTFFIAIKFVLFAAIAAGLIISIPSSIVKNVIFHDAIFKQPYSIYFTELFRNLFLIDNSGFLSIVANYIAETFIEIPNIIVTVFIGSIISMTILKYNTTMFTQHYQRKVKNNNIFWFKICMSNISVVEFITFIVTGYIYITTVKSVSNTILTTIMTDISVNSIQGFIFLEMISIPLIIIILLLFLKVIIPIRKNSFDFSYLQRNILNKKEFDSDIMNFILTLFLISIVIVLIYGSIIVNLTGITPIRYYQSNSVSPANVSNFLWLIILLVTFILIDKYNNNMTRDITLENELIKKQTITEISDSFDTQRQKLQALELNWSQDTVELLRSSRHDLINELEKTNTGFNDLLSEVYEKIVKPYKDAILENQKNTREHIEELGTGKLSKNTVSYIQEQIENQIEFYNLKLSPYIKITFDKFDEDITRFYCYTNRLIFIAINNILDNSIFALQKLLLDDNFTAKLNISLKVSQDLKNLIISITDNAGGVEESKLQKLYKEQIESSKGKRLGEGTIHTAYFVSILNGKITAANITDKNETGLKTNISIPMYKM